MFNNEIDPPDNFMVLLKISDKYLSSGKPTDYKHRASVSAMDIQYQQTIMKLKNVHIQVQFNK